MPSFPPVASRRHRLLKLPPHISVQSVCFRPGCISAPADKLLYFLYGRISIKRNARAFLTVAAVLFAVWLHASLENIDNISQYLPLLVRHLVVGAEVYMAAIGKSELKPCARCIENFIFYRRKPLPFTDFVLVDYLLNCEIDAVSCLVCPVINAIMIMSISNSLLFIVIL